VGDIFASILPPADSLRGILTPIVETFRELAEAFAPVLELIQNVLIVALKGLAIAVQVVLIPFKIIAEFIKGFIGAEETKLKSSAGAAARNLSFTSSEAGAKQFYAAAYKTGQGSGEYQSPLSGIKDTLDDILGVARDIGRIMGVAGKVNPVNTIKNISQGMKNNEEARGIAKQTIETQEGILDSIKKEMDAAGGKLAPDREKVIRDVLETFKGGTGGVGVGVGGLLTDMFGPKDDKADRLLDELNGNRDMAKQGWKS
jgi:hypothetical protein